MLSCKCVVSVSAEVQVNPITLIMKEFKQIVITMLFSLSTILLQLQGILRDPDCDVTVGPRATSVQFGEL